jgi:hypothetical protein
VYNSFLGALDFIKSFIVVNALGHGIDAILMQE